MAGMIKSFTGRKRVRKSFGRIPEVAPMPNLIEVQRRSYEQFLQREVKAEVRKDAGLQEVFKSVFPIRDFSNRAELQFVRYELEDPRYDVEECQQRGMTFAALLKVTLRLVVWDVDEETGARSIRDIKEQDVYMGDMPLMTDKGTFIINGTTRVIVSQMHRSPGVFFDHDKGKTHSSGKYLFAARVIPSPPAVRERINGLGIDPIGGTPEEFAELIRSERERWGPVIKRANIRTD